MQERELKSTRQGWCFSNGSDLQPCARYLTTQSLPIHNILCPVSPEPLKLYDFPLVTPKSVLY